MIVEFNRGIVRTAQWGKFPDCETTVLARKETDADDCIILATDKEEYAEYHQHTLEEVKPLIKTIIALFNRFEEEHNRRCDYS